MVCSTNESLPNLDGKYIFSMIQVIFYQQLPFPKTIFLRMRVIQVYLIYRFDCLSHRQKNYTTSKRSQYGLFGKN